jgi:hypothetical protein
MFRGFSKNSGFNGFPNQQFGKGARISLYGFPLCSFWLNAEMGVGAVSNLDPVSAWVDQVGLIQFTQLNPLYQPRLVKNAPSFGNRDLIDFHTAGRGLQAAVNTTVGTGGKTIAIVYEYSSVATQSRIIGDNDFANARSSGFSFQHGSVNNTTFRPWVGFGVGAGASYGFIGAPVYANDPRILVLTRENLILNGTQITINQAATPLITGVISWVGSNGAFGVSWSGIFRVAEIIVFDKEFNTTECINLSNALNSKYALY